jgi:inorganic triphosphatase YgiF
VPDLDRIADPDLRKRVTGIVGAMHLVPIFRVEVSRETRLVSPCAGASIEVSIDRGVIVAGESRVPVSEVELELKAGPASQLFELALAVSQRHAARLGSGRRPSVATSLQARSGPRRCVLRSAWSAGT